MFIRYCISTLWGTMRVADRYETVNPFVKGSVGKRIYEIGWRLTKEHELYWFGLNGGGELGEAEIHPVGRWSNLYSVGRGPIREGLYFVSKLLLNYPRIGGSKLSTFRDGWRHLRLMPLFVIVSFQVINFGISSKGYAVKESLDRPDRTTRSLMEYSILEEELLLAGIPFTIGFTLGLRIFLEWRASGYGELFGIKQVRVVMTPVAPSIQPAFFSFFISTLMLKEGFE